MAATTMSRREFARLSEEELLETYHREGDPRARDELVDRFMPFARKLALRHLHSREPLDDLVQVAYLGLLNAIERFDPRQGKGSPRLPLRRSWARSNAIFATGDG